MHNAYVGFGYCDRALAHHRKVSTLPAAPKTPPADWDEYLMPNTYFQNMDEVEVEFAGQGAVAGTSIFEAEVKPGKRATIHFTPSKKGTFEIGCHVEGHYEAGMKATLIVK